MIGTKNVVNSKNKIVNLSIPNEGKRSAGLRVMGKQKE
jgi:hypothetical protein